MHGSHLSGGRVAADGEQARSGGAALELEYVAKSGVKSLKGNIPRDGSLRVLVTSFEPPRGVPLRSVLSELVAIDKPGNWEGIWGTESRHSVIQEPRDQPIVEDPLVPRCT